MGQDAGALVRRAEEQGCLRFSDLEEFINQAQPTDDQLEWLCEELAERGVRLAEACEPRAIEYRTRELTAATTDTLRLFLNEASRYPLLTAAEERDLARRVEAGDRRAKERLVNSNLRLVVSIARNYRGRGVAMLDLVQEGILGLIQAVDRFDWRRGFRISTFATWSIRNAITSAIESQARTIRVPAEVAKTERELRRTEDELRERLGRHPTEHEVARAAAVSRRALRALHQSRRTVVSLDQPAAPDDHATLVDLVAADDGPLDETVEVSLRQESLRRVLDELPERDRRVLELRYGIGDTEPRTLAEVGRIVGVSAERIRQIELRALSRLAMRREIQALRAS